jgi:hypothetical protein
LEGKEGAQGTPGFQGPGKEVVEIEKIEVLAINLTLAL